MAKLASKIPSKSRQVERVILEPLSGGVDTGVGKVALAAIHFIELCVCSTPKRWLAAEKRKALCAHGSKGQPED